MQARNRVGIDLTAGGVIMRPGVWHDLPPSVVIPLAAPPNNQVELRIPYRSDLLWIDERGVHVLWMSPLSIHNGYGVAGETLATALQLAGINVYGYLSWFETTEDYRADVHKRLRSRYEDKLLVGVSFNPPGAFRLLPTPYRIGFTMYETTNPLAAYPEWKHDCMQVDRLWVPSEFCKTVFEAFVDRPVDVLPLPILPDYETYKLRNYKRNRKQFIFGMHGWLTDRKSPLETIEAFKRAFPKEAFPNVHLELKTWDGVCGRGRYNLPRLDDDRIRIYNEHWTRKQMVSWLMNLDCYVFPSKGEGFGLPPREALATGLPVIVSNHSGLTDLAESRYVWPLPTARVENSPLGGQWFIPDYDALIESMRDIYNRYEQAATKARRGAAWAMKQWGMLPIGKKAWSALTMMDAHRPVRLVQVGYDGTIPAEVRTALMRRIPLNASVLVVESEALRDTLQGHCRVTFKSDPYELLWSRGNRQFAACVSFGLYQTLYDAEVLKFAQFQSTYAPLILAVVPSVRFKGFYSEDSRLVRPNVWPYLLPGFVVDVEPVGEFDLLVIQHRDDAGAREVAQRVP